MYTTVNMHTLFSILAFLLAAAALGLSLWALRRSPQRMVWEAHAELAEQRAMLEKLLVRHRAAASTENVAKAREVRAANVAERRDLIAEAQAALGRGAEQGALALVPKGQPAAEDATLAALRKRAGL